ncbi:hypothetical protein HanRHA438_Chr10g0464971 [Helianthus annuus]|nr:hypothetical protein HanRHA438_Chr10g0464971 [Helianthus annuus]
MNDIGGMNENKEKGVNEEKAACENEGRIETRHMVKGESTISAIVAGPDKMGVEEIRAAACSCSCSVGLRIHDLGSTVGSGGVSWNLCVVSVFCVSCSHNFSRWIILLFN